MAGPDGSGYRRDTDSGQSVIIRVIVVVRNAFRLAVLLLAAALAGTVAAPASAADRCARSAALDVGANGGALFSTVSPFEHFGSNRTQVFPHTCTLRQLTGTASPTVATRTSGADFSTPYISATRRRGELYVYGYRRNPATEGGFVAKVDPRTLEQEWRTPILDPEPADGWTYPGVMAVHGNGYLYAVYASVMVKLDPETGRTLARRELPEDPDGTGAAYNGLVILPDGRIVTKKIERGPCSTPPGATASAAAIGGLFCSAANGLPSKLVVLSPRNLRILSRTTPPEPITGRITAGRTDGTDYVYGAGSDSLFRFRYRRGDLRFDRGWGKVTYRTGAQEPGTGPGMLGRFAVVQTNFVSSDEPMTVTAVDTRDSSHVFRIRPFAHQDGSWIVSKAALDSANSTIVTHDTAAGKMAAIHLSPKRGLRVRWRRDLTSLAFSALVGPPRSRQIVIPDASNGGDQVVWLDEDDGTERARSETLAPLPAPGNIVTPGFGGRFYYTSQGGTLWELRPEAP
ncbi:MAG: hypothetical protein R2718_07235 [Solirubrobacterales bacterium]